MNNSESAFKKLKDNAWVMGIQFAVKWRLTQTGSYCSKGFPRGIFFFFIGLKNYLEKKRNVLWINREDTWHNLTDIPDLKYFHVPLSSGRWKLEGSWSCSCWKWSHTVQNTVCLVVWVVKIIALISHILFLWG